MKQRDHHHMTVIMLHKSVSSPLLDVSSQISTISGMLTSLIIGPLILQCWKN